MEDFNSIFNRSSGGLGNMGQRGGLGGTPGLRTLAVPTPDPAPVERRGILDRIFAPVEAPQQTLFAATQNIAADGWTVRGLWDALSHGARYFNPWSNEARIDPNEIRNTLQGTTGDAAGWRGHVSNLAISLLYDPLLVTGALKGVGLLADGSRATKAVSVITNPLEGVVDVAGAVAKRAVMPAARTVTRAALGAERYVKAQNFGDEVMALIADRWWGASEALKGEVQKLQYLIQKGRVQAGHLLKSSADLGGGREGELLLARMLEDDSVLALRGLSDGTTLSSRQLRNIGQHEKRMDELGMDRGLTYQLYDQYKGLDMDIGKAATRAGVVAEPTSIQQAGSHLRRETFGILRTQQMDGQKLVDLSEQIRSLDLKRATVFDAENAIDRMNVFSRQLDEVNFRPTSHMGPQRSLGDMTPIPKAGTGHTPPVTPASKPGIDRATAEAMLFGGSPADEVKKMVQEHLPDAMASRRPNVVSREFNTRVRNVKRQTGFDDLLSESTDFNKPANLFVDDVADEFSKRLQGQEAALPKYTLEDLVARKEKELAEMPDLYEALLDAAMADAGKGMSNRDTYNALRGGMKKAKKDLRPIPGQTQDRMWGARTKAAKAPGRTADELDDLFTQKLAGVQAETSLTREQMLMEMKNRLANSDSGSKMEKAWGEFMETVGYSLSPESRVDEFAKRWQDASEVSRGVRDDVLDSLMSFAAREVTPLEANNSLRYMIKQDGSVGLNSHEFVTDLSEWLDLNPNMPAAGVLNHVRDKMLPHMNMTPEFNKAILEIISNSHTFSKGSDEVADYLVKLASGDGPIVWRTVGEAVNLVDPRVMTHPIIREAMGELLEATPRMMTEVAEVGGLIAQRNFTDWASGARRIDEVESKTLRDFFDGAKRAGVEREFAIHSDAGREVIEQLSAATGRQFDVMNSDDVADIFKMLDNGTGSLAGKFGSDVASLTPDPATGRMLPLPDSSDLGELAGMFVSPNTMRVLRNVEGIKINNNPQSRMTEVTLNVLRKGTGMFKIAKVILDPTAQVRNFISGLIAQSMVGTNPFNISNHVKAYNELNSFAKTNEMGRYLKLAEDAGVHMFQGTMSNTEIKKAFQALNPATDVNWPDQMVGVFENVKRVAIDNPTKYAAGTFELSEKMLKLSTFIDHQNKLERQWKAAGKVLDEATQVRFAKQAGAKAEQALFDYSDVPYAVEWARTHGVVPFITFPWKATGLLAQTLYEHPHRVLRYGRVAEEFNNSVAGTPDQVAREINSLPQYLRDQMVVKLPFNDQQNRPQYVDMSYFLPWFAVKDIFDDLAVIRGDRERGVAPNFREGMLSPPVMAIIDAIRRNEDTLGRPITKAGNTSAQNFAAITSFAIQFAAPPLAPGGSRSDSIGRAMQATARSGPETIDWLDALGKTARLGLNQDNITGRGGTIGQSQTQVGSGGVFNHLLEQTGADLGDGKHLLGALEGILGQSVASDPRQARASTRTQGDISQTEIHREIAQVKANRDYDMVEKRERLKRLRSQLRSIRASTNETLRGM